MVNTFLVGSDIVLLHKQLSRTQAVDVDAEDEDEYEYSAYAYAEYSVKYADDADAEYEDDITGRTIWYSIISVEFP